MRINLAIDDDVLIAAKAIAQHRDRSLGEVISDLARHSLRRSQAGASRNGIPLLPVKPDASWVTLEIANALRDGEP